MRTPHPDPRPSRPRARALPPGWLLSWAVVRATRTIAAVLALAALLVASCTDDVAANCPPLAHPEVLTVAAAAGDPCGVTVACRQPKGGER
jgi:ABC-type cobalamin transport system permease subunit